MWRRGRGGRGARARTADRAHGRRRVDDAGDERLGEAVAVMAVPSQGNEDITAKALRDAVIGTIANFKVPAEELIFVTQERLPRGATEKIQKRDIRDAISAKLGRVRWSLVAVAVW